MRQRLGTLLLVLLAAGCVDVFKLNTLRSDLSKEFHHDQVGVTLSDGLGLTVTFVNQVPAGAPCDSLVALALNVATFVRRNYQGFDSLQVVTVAFLHRGSEQDRKPTSSHLPFRFSREALQSGGLAADSANAVALCELDADQPPPAP